MLILGAAGIGRHRRHLLNGCVSRFCSAVSIWDGAIQRRLAESHGLPTMTGVNDRFAAHCYATYRVHVAPGDALGADGEVLVARYRGAAVTDADRDAAAAQLREHYAAGRLSLDEFQDRLDAVYRAQTARELGTVTDSLPHLGAVIPRGRRGAAIHAVTRSPSRRSAPPWPARAAGSCWRSAS